MATPPTSALSNVHISSSHKRPSLETDLVLCDVSTLAWTRVPWVLEGKIHNFVLASFPVLLTVQFMIAFSMQKRRGKAWFILSCE